ncbi:resolvase domain [Acetobacter orientalis]|uniref:Resolvase domain n=1 Tax=Acetobacter orientalis TaxID=146474 RepID=A0A2Z5ZE96_9PROT|nr:resolvase domain [Acetobacter orientalis]
MFPVVEFRTQKSRLYGRHFLLDISMFGMVAGAGFEPAAFRL